MTNKNIHLSDCAFGYIFDNGIYDKPYIFLNTVTNIANFIRQNKDKKLRIADANNHDLINLDHGQFDDRHSIHSLYYDVIKAEDIKNIEFIEKQHEWYQNEIIKQVYLDI